MDPTRPNEMPDACISLGNFIFYFLKGKCLLNTVGQYFLLTEETVLKFEFLKLTTKLCLKIHN